MEKHRIDLPGIGNARELGGYQIGARTVRRGVLLRTARLDQAGPEALKILEERYHVQTVIDFRMTEERRRMPDPVIARAGNLFLSVFDMQDLLSGDPSKTKTEGSAPDRSMAAEVIARYSDPKADRISVFRQISALDLIHPDFYVSFLLGEKGKHAYRSFFGALSALEKDRAILWHCTDGKDRTGCAAMLLLFALGASRETVMADYLLTNEANAQRLQAVREAAVPHHLDADQLQLLLFLSGGAAEDFMNRAIDALIDRYGSVEQYLEREMGLDAAGRDALRSRFLA